MDLESATIPTARKPTELEEEIAKLASKRSAPPTLVDDLNSIRDAIRALDNQVQAFQNRLLNTVGGR